MLLWASTKLTGLLTATQQKAIIDEALSKQQPDGGFDEEVKTGAARKGGVPPPIVRETRTLPEYV